MGIIEIEEEKLKDILFEAIYNTVHKLEEEHQVYLPLPSGWAEFFVRNTLEKVGNL